VRRFRNGDPAAPPAAYDRHGRPSSLWRCWPSRRTTTQRTSRACRARATFDPARADVGGWLAGSPRREIADRLPAPSPRGPQRAVVRSAVVDDITQQIRPSQACRLGTARSHLRRGLERLQRRREGQQCHIPPLTSSPSPPYPPSPSNPRSPRTWPCARPAMRNWHHCAIPSTSPAPPIPPPTPVRHRGYGTPSTANSPPHPGTRAESYLLNSRVARGNLAPGLPRNRLCKDQHNRFGGRPRGKGPDQRNLAARPTQPRPARARPDSMSIRCAAGPRGGAGPCRR
jgi:hypothetical protein